MSDILALIFGFFADVFGFDPGLKHGQTIILLLFLLFIGALLWSGLHWSGVLEA
jgi:hypothetical protein